MSNRELHAAINHAAETIIAPEEVNTVRFLGVGSPEDIQAQHEERVRNAKEFKNRKARQAAQRANTVLADIGLSRRDRRQLTAWQRKHEPKKLQNYRWSPESES